MVPLQLRSFQPLGSETLLSPSGQTAGTTLNYGPVNPRRLSAPGTFLGRRALDPKQGWCGPSRSMSSEPSSTWAASVRWLRPSSKTRKASSNLWRNKQLEFTFLLTMMGRFATFSEITRRALASTAHKFGVRLALDQVEALMRTWEELPIFPDALPTLKDLHTRYVLAVLSNGETHTVRDVLRQGGLDRFFSEVICADEVGAYKPSPTRLCARRGSARPFPPRDPRRLVERFRRPRGEIGRDAGLLGEPQRWGARRPGHPPGPGGPKHGRNSVGARFVVIGGLPLPVISRGG